MVRRSSTETFQRLRGHPRRDHAAHRRPARPALARATCMRECEPRGDLQPRRDVVRGGVVEPARADRRVHRRRASRGCSRRCARSRPEARFYQASSLGDVRQGAARCRRRETHALLPALAPTAWPRCYGHFITVNYRESLRPVRLLRDPLQPRERAPRARVRHPQGHPRAPPRSSSGSQDELALGNLDAERDWGYAKDYVEAMWLMLQQDEPDDYVIATGEAHRVRELVDVAFAHVGLDPDEHVAHRPALPAPRRGRAPDRRLLEGAREARLGAAHELRGDGAADGRRRPRAARQRGAPEAGGLRWRRAPAECDLAVVGGGILGLAVARELHAPPPGPSRRRARARRRRSAGGQTGANSGVIHAGIYYAPGSLKARLCVEGAREMYEYCEQHGDPARALRQADRGARRGRAGPARRARAARARERGAGAAPAVGRRAAPRSSRTAAAWRRCTRPTRASSTSPTVARALARRARATRGAPVVTRLRRSSGERSAAGRHRARATRGGETRARFAVFCAGARLGPAGGGGRRARRTRASCPSAAPTCTCGPSAASWCAR